MLDKLMSSQGLGIEEIKSFSNITALFEWLLLVLVLFYLILNREILDANPSIIFPLILFAVFVLLFHYSGLVKSKNSLTFSLEIWVMTIFITVVVAYTHHLASPLVDLYLLPVITSALLLRKNETLLLVGLVTAFCYLVGYWQLHMNLFTLKQQLVLLEIVSPILLVAYVTSILATDIKQSQSKLRVLSETDQLTGLFNMRAFNTFLRLEISRAQRYGNPFSLLMIDCDYAMLEK